MRHQNQDQAEQLIAEVFAAACLVIGSDAGSSKDRGLARRLLRTAYEALRSRQITVHSQAGSARETQLPNADDGSLHLAAESRIVMRKRGRQVELDAARLRSHGALITVGRWCKSALRSNLEKAFKRVGYLEAN